MGRWTSTAIVVLVVLTAPVAVAETAKSPVAVPFRLSGYPTTDVVVVERGDNLWKIAERHLIAIGSDQAVARYWRVVIATNVGSLRSGDPNLIYPGEMIELPPVTAQP